MDLGIAKRVAPKIATLKLKGKKVSPDVAIIGGLSMVIAGGIWLGKRSHDAAKELDETSAKIESIKSKPADPETKRELMEARKDYGIKVVKTVVGPIIMIGTGCYLVIRGRNGYKSRVMEIGTLLSTQTGRFNRLANKVDEEHGEGTAEKWARGLEDVIVDYKDPETKKKERTVVTVDKTGIDGFAFEFDDRSRRYSKDGTLNRLMFKNADKILNNAYENRVVTGMEWCNEIGLYEQDMRIIYTNLYGADEANDLVRSLINSGWRKGVTCAPGYHYDDVYKNENESFLQGYMPRCIIEPVGMLPVSELV